MYNILKQLIEKQYSIINSITNEAYHSVNSYLAEVRTVILSVPRRSGKTWALNKLRNEYSSLVLTLNDPMNRALYNGEAYTSFSQIERFIRGVRSNGLKYRFILIDEGTLINIEMLVAMLSVANLLEQNYLIIRVGTFRCN